MIRRRDPTGIESCSYNLFYLCDFLAPHIGFEFIESFLLGFRFPTDEVLKGVRTDASRRCHSLHSPLLYQDLKIRSEPGDAIGGYGIRGFELPAT